MLYPVYISSSENKHVKTLKQIFEFPKKHAPFVLVEGIKHVFDFAESSHYRLVRWFIDEIFDFTLLNDYQDQLDKSKVTFIKSGVFSDISEIKTSQGIIGLFERTYNIEETASFSFEEPTFILDCITDPGNMGTIIRTAVAFGRKQIIILGGVYPESPKVIRASAGLLGRIRILRTSFEEFARLIVQKNIPCIGTKATGEMVENISLAVRRKSFIILGNEANGINSFWDSFHFQHAAIPMSSGVESLNVSVVGGIFSYLFWGAKSDE